MVNVPGRTGNSALKITVILSCLNWIEVIRLERSLVRLKATGEWMIRKRVLASSTAGFGTLWLCLAIPLSIESTNHPEPSPFAFVDHLLTATWIEDSKAQAELFLNTLVQPILHKIPMIEAAIDPGKGGDKQNDMAVAAAQAPALSVPPAPAGLLEAIAFYKANDLQQGDELAKTVTYALAALTLDWVALKTSSHKVGFARLQNFAATHPDWPANGWLHRRAEEALYGEHRDKKAVEAFFAETPPETAYGKLALAQALAADDRLPEAQRIVRTLWRETMPLSPTLETKIRADFGTFLEKTDYKSRADHFLYKEDTGEGLRMAALAGDDVLSLAQARVAVINEAASDKLLQKVATPLKADPGYLFAEIQKNRRADKIKDAVDIMLRAPRDPERLVNGDEWWVERRLLARKLLDQGDAKLAYRLCAEHSAQSNESKIEAEFHAGWIALRFLNDPVRAAAHFARTAELAATPMSVARATYWQGRAAEAIDAPDALQKATAFFEKAAAYSTTYYGQLARAQLGLSPTSAGASLPIAPAAQPTDVVRVVELLFSIGEKDLASSLAAEAVQHLTDQSQVAALADIVARQQDAHLALSIGKLANQRGIILPQLAFPTYGIPAFQPLQNSAAKSIVYSIARQESAFDARAMSKAGAKGLMQMIASTAKRTAEQAGLTFDENRLLNDATFNAQLGAAHLGALLSEQGGSLILTFAAYNAGGGRVKKWIEAYGDPRSAGVDPIDWVERIPFTETRNYVQRVLENVAVYQARFGDTTAAIRENGPKAEAKL